MSNNNNSSDTGTTIKQTCITGLGLDSVQVHSSPLAVGAGMSIGATAYTSGNDIHISSGQESHLPHEAWHIVQQK